VASGSTGVSCWPGLGRAGVVRLQPLDESGALDSA